MQPNRYVFYEKNDTRLAIMPKPSSEWLAEDIQFLKLDGFDIIVSMLEQSEAAEIGLAGEGEVCEKLGLSFISFPILDRGIPDNRTEFSALIEGLRDDFVAGQSIAIHCRAGIGRSGMVCVGMLISLGHSVDDAVALVFEARGVEIPDTPEQTEFLCDIEGNPQAMNKSP